MTLVGVNWRLAALEVAQILHDAGPALVMVDHDLSELLAETVDLPPVVTLTGEASDLEQWLGAGEGSVVVDRSTPDNIVIMLYTPVRRAGPRAR